MRDERSPAPEGAGDPAENALLVAYQAALTVASETRLESVLQRLVDLARTVASARYAALGIADASGRLTQFIHSGLTAEQVARIGPLPKGFGLLGVLIHDGTPLMVPEIADDPRSVGFPPNHPPMHSLLGVPIFLEGRPIGNLYLTERTDGAAFREADLAAIEVLAAHAATAVQRAQLIDQLQLARRQAESERDHVQVIIDQLPSGIFIQLAGGGRIELANWAAKRMVNGGDLPADGVEVTPPRFRRADGTTPPEREFPGMRALAGERISQQQLQLIPERGAPIPVFVQAAPLTAADGTIERAVIVLQDMTRLREAEQLKDDFLSLVSHEFRTPLTAIHGGARLLGSQRESLDLTTRNELLADIVQESARLDQMLANMLQLAEVMAGRLAPTTEPVLFGPLVRGVVQEMQQRLPDVHWETEIPAGVPPVEGDPALLQQVMRNLYENAIKYTAGSVTIRTVAEVSAGEVAIHVIDNGIGIAPEHVPFVFERFRRPGADPSVRGMGLGLYLCHHLMSAQGGRIWVESHGVGKGTTFSIALPIAIGWSDDE